MEPYISSLKSLTKVAITFVSFVCTLFLFCWVLCKSTYCYISRLTDSFYSSSETILSEKIYQQIRVPGPNTLSFFIKESRNAFEEVKVAVYSILKSITVHKWGLEIMKGSHEFGPFILNRHLESTKVGLEWKYAILQSIRTNPFFRSLFDEIFVAGVEKYLKDGVFYSEHVPIVEVEGGL